MSEAVVTRRQRDPARKERILAAAVDLVARNGFHAVSMTDIGAEAGITGSGIYRHFDSKSAILVALFEQTVDGLLEDQRVGLQAHSSLDVALLGLIDGQVEFVVNARELAQVYHIEVHNLPEEDRIRLRRKQRLYIEEWVHLLRELRPELDDATARTLVHAAVGSIQSTLFHNVGLSDDQLKRILAGSASAIFELDAKP